jgi:hypothetical protein
MIREIVVVRPKKPLAPNGHHSDPDANNWVEWQLSTPKVIKRPVPTSTK